MTSNKDISADEFNENEENDSEVGAEFVDAPKGENVHSVFTDDFSIKALSETLQGKQLRISWDTSLPREEQAAQIAKFAAAKGVYLTDEQVNNFIDIELKKFEGK